MAEKQDKMVINITSQPRMSDLLHYEISVQYGNIASS